MRSNTRRWPGDVLADDERTEADDLRRAACRAPHARGEVAGVERGLELVARHDRQVVEDPQAGRERRRERDDDRRRIGRAHLERLAADQQRIGERAAGSSVVDRREREQDIVGREGLAVGEGDALPQLQRVPQAVVGAGPAFGEPRLDLLRRAVDAHELRLGEQRHELGRRVAAREAVEGARLGADGDDEVAAAEDARGRRARAATDASMPAASGRERAEGDGKRAPNDRVPVWSKSGSPAKKLADQKRVQVEPAYVILRANSGRLTPSVPGPASFLAGRPVGPGLKAEAILVQQI